MQSILENREAQSNVKMFYLLPPRPYTHTWEILVDSRQLISVGTCLDSLVKWRGVCRKLCLLNTLSDGYLQIQIFYVIFYFRENQKSVSASSLAITQFLKAGITASTRSRNHRLTVSLSVLFGFHIYIYTTSHYLEMSQSKIQILTSFKTSEGLTALS